MLRAPISARFALQSVAVVAVALAVAGCGAPGTAEDDAGPGILTISSHDDGDVVRKERVRIKGSAPAGAEIVRDIAFGPDDRTTANGGGRWAIAVDLAEGENELTFRIGDADETAVTVHVTYEPRTGGRGTGSNARNDGDQREAPLGKAPQGQTKRATVLSVTDGDTIRVLVDGREAAVRYIGIDAPEVTGGAEWMGAEASVANANLVAGQVVVLERDVSKRDQYGRLLRYVWLKRDDGWLLVNRELVRRGFATAVSYPPDVKYDAILARAERNAAEGVRGLWASPPEAPAPTPLTLIPQAPAVDCEPSYPDVCIPIGSADVDCGAIDARRFTVLWNVPLPDPHGFDADADGIGCESG